MKKAVIIIVGIAVFALGLFLGIGIALGTPQKPIAISQEKELEEMPEWSSGEWVDYASFTMEGRNSTPPKRIKTDTYSILEVKVNYRADEPILFMLGVYSGGNEVIPRFQVQPLAESGKDVIVQFPVEDGYEVQIYTQAWKADGTFDENFLCDIDIAYRLTN